MYIRQKSLSKPLNIKILCLGTNRAPRASALQWAEKDALDVARLFRGHVGCTDQVICYRAPTIVQVRAALAEIARTRPDVFVFYNSGHGSPAGFSLADDTFSYKELARWISFINAKHSLTILDVCHAGAFIRKHAALGEVVGAVDFMYLELIATATVSSRVICSVGASRLSLEGGSVQNGHMTASLLEAAAWATGTLQGWISDEELFTLLERISIDRFGQYPVALGLTGDFPVVRAQTVMDGAAAIIDNKLVGDEYRFTALVVNRFGIPTSIIGELRNRSGRIFTTLERRFVPENDRIVETAGLTVPPDALLSDRYARLMLHWRGVVPLVWHVEVRDLRGRVFDRCLASIRWSHVRRVA